MEGYKKVAVVGASGLLGKPLVRQLAKAGFELTLLSRDSNKLRDTFHDVGGVKFKEVEPNDQDGLVEALTGRFYSTLVELILEGSTPLSPLSVPLPYRPKSVTSMLRLKLESSVSFQVNLAATHKHLIC